MKRWPGPALQTPTRRIAHVETSFPPPLTQAATKTLWGASGTRCRMRLVLFSLLLRCRWAGRRVTGLPNRGRFGRGWVQAGGWVDKCIQPAVVDLAAREGCEDVHDPMGQGPRAALWRRPGRYAMEHLHAQRGSRAGHVLLALSFYEWQGRHLRLEQGALGGRNGRICRIPMPDRNEQRRRIQQATRGSFWGRDLPNCASSARSTGRDFQKLVVAAISTCGGTRRRDEWDPPATRGQEAVSNWWPNRARADRARGGHDHRLRIHDNGEAKYKEAARRWVAPGIVESTARPTLR